MKQFLIIIAIISMVATLGAQNMRKIIMKTNMGDMEIELWPDVAPKTVENFIGLADGTKEWTDPTTGEKVKKPFYNGLIFHRVIKDFMIQGGCPLGNGTGGPGYRFEDEFPQEQVTGDITSEDVAIQVYMNILRPYLMQNENPDPEVLAVAEEVQKKQNGSPLMQHTIEWYQEKTGVNEPIYRMTQTVDYGTICMANSGPNTNGSQFFIVTKKEGCNWLNGKHTVFGKVTKGMDIAHKIENVEKLPGDKPKKDVVIEEIVIVK